MSGPLRAPWTDTGRLQSDIQSLESKLRLKADSYEITQLRQTIDRLDSQVSDLERTLGEIRAENYGLVSRIEALEERLNAESQEEKP